MIKKKGLGAKNTRSDLCPHCGKTIKAHKGNTKEFAGLTPKQQSSSIQASVINLSKMMNVRHKTRDDRAKCLQTIFNMFARKMCD